MSKNKNAYVCQECGTVHKKWSGQCSACSSWDSIVEELDSGFSNMNKKESGNVLEFVGLSGEAQDVERSKTSINELDRVLGGGLVRGSVVLIGGDPGIGKSTLLLQVMASLANSRIKTAYISGEESIDQVRLRAKRLKLDKSEVKLMSATSVKDIIATLKKQSDINVLVIDSIQTRFIDEIASAPGTVSQIRASSHEIITYAKKNNIAVFLIGHVTKEGQIAGPKLLEHMVDTVLYFEGDRGASI